MKLRKIRLKQVDIEEAHRLNVTNHPEMVHDCELCAMTPVNATTYVTQGRYS